MPCRPLFLEHLQPTCTSAESVTQGEPAVLVFTSALYSPLTPGCYWDELSVNQVSARVCWTWTVILWYSEWALRGKIRRSLVEQVVFSSTASVPQINRPEYWHTIPSADTAYFGTDLMREIVTRLWGQTDYRTQSCRNEMIHASAWKSWGNCNSWHALKKRRKKNPHCSLFRFFEMNWSSKMGNQKQDGSDLSQIACFHPR